METTAMLVETRQNQLTRMHGCMHIGMHTIVLLLLQILNGGESLIRPHI